jgi:hypothetical protein
MLALLRFLAACFLLVAVFAAVDDYTRSGASGRTVVSGTAEHWERLSPTSFKQARASVQRSTHPLVWDYGVGQILRVPTWGLFGFLGLLLAYAGRRRKRVNVFAN